MASKSNRLGFETRAIHAAQSPCPLTGAVVQPVYTTSTFVQDAIGKNKGYLYSRAKNPTRDVLEGCLADLEGAAMALAFPTGLAAASTIIELLDAGSEVLIHHDLYGGIYRLFTHVKAHSAGLVIKSVNFSDMDAVKAAITPQTKMMWFETPSNPLLEIVDIEAITQLARKGDILSVCDNTFASPYCQRPIEMGVDLVLHSATKFLNGHSDLLAGVVAASAHLDGDVVDRLRFLQSSLGAVLDPISCATLLRSVKTLPVRMDRHLENAELIAAFLDENQAALGISKLKYPGLKDHPGHDIAARQMKGFGSLMSFEVTGGEPRANSVAQRLNLFAFAVSLGGVESLVQHPASMTHKIVPKAQRDALGITEGLLRLSVGIELCSDLIADLEQALT